jgi:hypothetical protein
MQCESGAHAMPAVPGGRWQVEVNASASASGILHASLTAHHGTRPWVSLLHAIGNIAAFIGPSLSEAMSSGMGDGGLDSATNPGLSNSK